MSSKYTAKSATPVYDTFREVKEEVEKLHGKIEQLTNALAAERDDLRRLTRHGQRCDECMESKTGLAASQAKARESVWCLAGYRLAKDVLARNTIGVDPLTEPRNRVLEEAARICDTLVIQCDEIGDDDCTIGNRACARQIRAAKKETK